MNKESKAFWARAALFLAFGVLLLRLAQIQLVQHKDFFRLADENAARVFPIHPPRGWFLDRSGRLIVSNESQFSLYFVPEIVDRNGAKTVAQKLARVAQIPATEFQKLFAAARSRPFEPALIRREITVELAVRLEEARQDLPGIVVEHRPMRRYREGNLAIHTLGTVGEISAAELARYAASHEYAIHDTIGKSGLELAFDSYVRGRRGGRKVEVDVFGRPIRLAETVRPQPGANVRLTLDLPLQRRVEESLKGHRGAVVVLDPRSGEVLALSSQPAFNPDRMEEALNDPAHPFVNRAVSEFPPGSIFKVVTFTAALETAKATLQETIQCPGWYQLGARVARCWRSTGHGILSVVEGIVWSCDVVFYELGQRLGIGPLSRYAKEYGLGEATGIELPEEKPGFVPSVDWKERVLKEPWYPGDYINMGIGQGFLKVTPLQMAIAYGAIATGKRIRPYLVQQIEDPTGKIIWAHRPQPETPLHVSAKTLDLLRAALRQVILRGTGVAARVSGLPAAGKTGTAENPGPAHAWFVAYAPHHDPEIVISVFVEHGLHGDRAAAYVARDILHWYSEHRAVRRFYEDPEFPPQHVVQGPYQPEFYTTKLDHVEVVSREAEVE